jgi:spore germination protein GerM
MIKNKFKTKILLLIICLLVMLISTKKKELQIKEEVIYTGLNVYPATIYLIDKDNYLAKTEVELEGKTDLDKAREIIEILINDGKYEEKIPNGFKSVISSNTKIIDISLKDKILKINFNSSLLEINENKVIESLTYSLTSQENIDGIIIFINDKILNTDYNIPLTKEIGINKIFDLDNIEDVTNVTVYYLNKYNDLTYYVPVTKYMNDTRDKLTLIIEELNQTSTYTTNLMTFMNNDVKLISSTLEDENLILNFNEAILEDENYILEEVIYTILYSIEDNFEVKSVIFNVENKKILKKDLK